MTSVPRTDRREERALQTFSPREVQSRVRGGDSAEVIAAETGWPLDKVLRYAEPLLAERAFVAQQAQTVEIRRSGGGATLLESSYAALGADPDAGSIEWDAWRREDGRWIVVAAYSDATGRHAARWTYDHAGRNLHPLDDEARALMGARPLPLPDPEAEIAEALDLVQDVAVVREDAAVADTRPRLVAVPDAPADSDDSDHSDLAAESAEFEEIEVPEDVEIVFFPEGTPVPSDTEPTVALPQPEQQPASKPARRPKAKKGGRASVPSWDEILFGATKHDE